jgi:hypothetical protein
MNDQAIEKSTDIQPRRRGFQPGRSGNPSGKPRGTKSKSTQLIERLVTGNPADVKQIIDVVVRAAKAGEPWAAQEILKRIWPVPRSRLVKFPFPELATIEDVRRAMDAVTSAVSNGILTIEEAAGLADIISKHAAPVLEASEVTQRLEILEAERKERGL